MLVVLTNLHPLSAVVYKFALQLYVRCHELTGDKILLAFSVKLSRSIGLIDRQHLQRVEGLVGERIRIRCDVSADQ